MPKGSSNRKPRQLRGAFSPYSNTEGRKKIWAANVLELILEWPAASPPRRNSKDPREARLGSFLERNVFRPRPATRFPEIVALLRERRPDWFADLREGKVALEELLLPAASRSGDEHAVDADGNETDSSRLPKPSVARRHEIAKTLLLSDRFEDRPLTTSQEPLMRRMAYYLNLFLTSGSSAYDPKFALALNREKPRWFRGRPRPKTSPVREKRSARRREAQKKALLARRNRPRFGKGRCEKNAALALASFCDPSHEHYDDAFAKKLREKNPSWFAPEALGRHLKTDEVRAMLFAWDDAKKPHFSATGLELRLYEALRRWCSPRSRFYDADFDRRIREKKPLWVFAWDKRAVSESLRSGPSSEDSVVGETPST